jgi:hypothetical protein
MNKATTHMLGQRLGTFFLSFCLPDSWLEVSTHSEGSATDHLDTGFPCFFSVFKQML